MLKPNLEPSHNRPNLDIIPDPWETSTVVEAISSSISLSESSVKMKEHPLIKAAGQVDALRIAPPKSHPEQTLLGDWLKLKAEATQELAIQVKQALGLLYWLENAA